MYTLNRFYYNERITGSYMYTGYYSPYSTCKRTTQVFFKNDSMTETKQTKSSLSIKVSGTSYIY